MSRPLWNGFGRREREEAEGEDRGNGAWGTSRKPAKCQVRPGLCPPYRGHLRGATIHLTLFTYVTPPLSTGQWNLTLPPGWRERTVSPQPERFQQNEKKKKEHDHPTVSPALFPLSKAETSKTRVLIKLRELDFKRSSENKRPFELATRIQKLETY